MHTLNAESVPVAPERSYQQRMDALVRANDTRMRRSDLKKKLRREQVSGVEVVTSPAPYLETMKVFELLLALPKVGRVKANKLMARSSISPSKTLGGLSERQRRELAALLSARPRASFGIVR